MRDQASFRHSDPRVSCSHPSFEPAIKPDHRQALRFPQYQPQEPRCGTSACFQAGAGQHAHLNPYFHFQLETITSFASSVLLPHRHREMATEAAAFQSGVKQLPYMQTVNHCGMKAKAILLVGETVPGGNRQQLNRSESKARTTLSTYPMM